MKIRPFTLPVEAGSILVCGSSRPAATLYDRITKAVEGLAGWTVIRSIIPKKGYDYIYSTSAVPEGVARSCRETMVITDDSAEGKTRNQECLCNSDWQAIRDVERQFLAMHVAGIWVLPNDVRSRMTERETLRVKVDGEAGVIDS